MNSLYAAPKNGANGKVKNSEVSQNENISVVAFTDG